MMKTHTPVRTMVLSVAALSMIDGTAQAATTGGASHASSACANAAALRLPGAKTAVRARRSPAAPAAVAHERTAQPARRGRVPARCVVRVQPKRATGRHGQRRARRQGSRRRGRRADAHANASNARSRRPAKSESRRPAKSGSRRPAKSEQAEGAVRTVEPSDGAATRDKPNASTRWVPERPSRPSYILRASIGGYSAR